MIDIKLLEEEGVDGDKCYEKDSEQYKLRDVSFVINDEVELQKNFESIPLARARWLFVYMHNPHWMILALKNGVSPSQGQVVLNG